MKQTIYLGTLLMALAVAREPIAVTVNYANQAGVPNRILRAALNEATFLFNKADIEITWVDCTSFEGAPEVPRHCRHADPTRFRITFKNDPSIQAVTMGFAYPTIGSRNRAAVMYSHVTEFASKHAGLSDVEFILAAAITHELGHLFFGTTEHGDGIMLPHWRKAHVKKIGQRGLRFSATQAETMRAGLAARQNQDFAMLR